MPSIPNDPEPRDGIRPQHHPGECNPDSAHSAPGSALLLGQYTHSAPQKGRGGPAPEGCCSNRVTRAATPPPEGVTLQPDSRQYRQHRQYRQYRSCARHHLAAARSIQPPRIGQRHAQGKQAPLDSPPTHSISPPAQYHLSPSVAAQPL